jgi:WD40 repeat protein/subtilisin-like proprotein convertase family protein
MVAPGDTPDSRAKAVPLPARPMRRAADFFVAGGPVTPERACYLARATDEALYERLAAGDYCHVIAPRFSGKTSLAARAVNRLRAEGRLAALVDLSQLGSRDGTTETGRWYYGLAYRILRDLRLKLDLQSWWQERLPLPPAQRLGEFFGEIVLGASRVPVTLFLDEIDSIEQLEHASELFGIVRACHDARAAEPEYRRLNFVLLGTPLATGPAEIGARLELPDFRFEQVRPLAAGLPLPPGDAERALYRILYWTGGHPYLTQKLCQAVARNAARINGDEAVDRLVAARFFARNVITSETSMGHVLDGLDRAGKLARPALRLYRRIRRGRRLKYEPGNPQHELLRVCGLVTVTAERKLVVRNRIFAEVFTHHWIREALPVEWGRIGRVAAVTAIAAAAIWAYVEVLPKPYQETLRVASVELDEAIEAWAALGSMPGFGGRANRLLARVLIRGSRLAEHWPDAEAFDARLRALPGYQATADALLVEFWERRAAAAEAAERRDEALLYRLRAYVSGPTADAGRAAELAGGDYQQLRTVIRPAGVVEAIAPAADGRGVVTVSGGNILERWNANSGLQETGGRLELLAEEFVTIRRRLSVDVAGRIAAPGIEIELAVDHPRPADLHIVLTSPAGRQTELPIARATERGGALAFDAARVPGLRAVQGEEARGTWLLEIEDRGSGQAGFFGGWSLRASASGPRAEDRPENPLLLPVPASSSAVRVALAPRGSVVAALPRNPEARGRLHTWDVASGSLLASVDVGAGERWAGFANESMLLLLESSRGGQRLRVLDAHSGEERLVQDTETQFAAGPAVSADGRYVALVDGASKVARILDLDTGREVFRLPSAGDVLAVAVAPGGLLLAVADRGDVVRVWHATDGALLGEFPHDVPVAALAFDPSGRWLATADLGQQLRVWDLSAPGPYPVLSRPGGDPRQFAFDSAGRRLVTLGPAGGYELWGLPEAMPYGPILRHGGLRASSVPTFDRVAAPQLMLAEDGKMVGGRGTRSVTVWAVDEGAPTDLPRIAPVVALASSGLRTGAGLADGRVTLRTRDPDSLVMRQSLVTTGEARHGGGVTALAFSPDGGRLVSVGADGSVLLWHAGTGRHIGGLFHHGSGRVESVDLGPDGRLLVTAGEFGARVWEAQGGVSGPSLGPGRAVSVAALDVTGERAFTGTPEGDVESWHVSTGERLWFGLVDAPVTRIAVSTDGLRLAVASDTGLVQAWGLGPGGRPLSVALAAPVLGLQFAPNGRAVLAQTPAWIHRLGVEDGRLRVLTSRLLPAAVPPGAWRSAEPDGSRIVLVAGAHSETMAVLDLARAPLPPEDWQPDLDAWQRKLKLFFTADGELLDGVPPQESPGITASAEIAMPGL